MSNDHERKGFFDLLRRKEEKNSEPEIADAALELKVSAEEAIAMANGLENLKNRLANDRVYFNEQIPSSYNEYKRYPLAKYESNTNAKEIEREQSREKIEVENDEIEY